MLTWSVCKYTVTVCWVKHRRERSGADVRTTIEARRPCCLFHLCVSRASIICVGGRCVQCQWDRPLVFDTGVRKSCEVVRTGKTNPETFPRFQRLVGVATSILGHALLDTRCMDDVPCHRRPVVGHEMNPGYYNDCSVLPMGSI